MQNNPILEGKVKYILISLDRACKTNNEYLYFSHNKYNLFSMEVQIDDILDNAKGFIKNDLVKECLELLFDNSKKFSQNHNTLILLASSQFHNWNKKKSMGLMDNDQENIEHNKIVKNIIEIINIIKNEYKLSAFGENTSMAEADLTINELFVCEFFPNYSYITPYGKVLEELFFDERSSNKGIEFYIHGPNVIRFTKGLLLMPEEAPKEKFKDFTKGLFRPENSPKTLFYKDYGEIIEALLEINQPKSEKNTYKKNININQQELDKIIKILAVAALYHDIGKFIRRPNHPQLGANLLKNLDPESYQRLVKFLRFPSDTDSESMYNRFALITSVVQHHDKFGVVSTGEAGLPIFSDILYFSSDGNEEKSILGIKKNITAVMLVNLADIAAVNNLPESEQEYAQKISKKIYAIRQKINSNNYNTEDVLEEASLLEELYEICLDQKYCLGLEYRKISTVLEDWRRLMDVIDLPEVKGDRVKLKNYLIYEEAKPNRTIKRVHRLIEESMVRAGIQELSESQFLSQSLVELVFVSTLGSHQFQSFCEHFAMVVKMDYSLKFFRSIVTACIRKKIYENPKETLAFQCKSHLSLISNTANGENSEKSVFLKKVLEPDKLLVAKEISTIVIKVLESLVSRHSSILTYNITSPRRFGFQLRELSDNKNIWDNIIRLLCIESPSQSHEPIALTWIADEVTLWSFD